MTRGFYVAESKFNVKIIKFEMADLIRPDKFKQFYLAFLPNSGIIDKEVARIYFRLLFLII